MAVQLPREHFTIHNNESPVFVPARLDHYCPMLDMGNALVWENYFTIPG